MIEAIGKLALMIIAFTFGFWAAKNADRETFGPSTPSAQPGDGKSGEAGEADLKGAR